MKDDCRGDCACGKRHHLFSHLASLLKSLEDLQVSVCAFIAYAVGAELFHRVLSLSVVLSIRVICTHATQKKGSQSLMECQEGLEGALLLSPT